MDGPRFDSWARNWATGTSRRRLLKAAVGSVVAATVLRADVRAASPKPLKRPRPQKRPGSCSAGQSPSCASGCCPADTVCVEDRGCAPQFHDPCGGGYCSEDDATQACIAEEGCAPVGSKACAGNRYCAPGLEVCVAGTCVAIPLDQCAVGDGFGASCGGTCGCFDVALGDAFGALCFGVPNPIGSLCEELQFCSNHDDCPEGSLCVSRQDCSADAVCLPLCPSYGAA